MALFLTGQTISMLGSMLVQFAIFWHLALELKSGAAMALAAVFGFLPQAVVSIFGGVWADRLDCKKHVIYADAGIAVVALALAIALTHSESFWLVFAAIALRSPGAGAGIQSPAASALLPRIASERHLLRINGIFSTIQSAMMLLAPTLAAVLCATSRWSPCSSSMSPPPPPPSASAFSHSSRSPRSTATHSHTRPATPGPTCTGWFTASSG